MNGDKLLPLMEPEMKEEEEVEETALLRNTFRHESQSNISTDSDSDEMYSEDFRDRKSVVRDEQDEQGIGFSYGSSPLEVNGDHHVIYEVCPTDEIEPEAITTRETSSQNGTTIKQERDQIPLPVAYQRFSNGANEEQTSQYTSLSNGIVKNERVEFRTENGNEVADLYLERVYEKPSSHNFYCPNCQACIKKVIIRDREWVNDATSAPIPTPIPVDKFRCTSCFSFLIPIGIWFFPKLASTEEEASSEQGHNNENIGIRKRETLRPSQETSQYQGTQKNTAPVPDQSDGYVVTDKNKGDRAATVAHPSLEATIAEGQEKIVKVPVLDLSVGIEVADQTQKSAWAKPNLAETHPSIHAEVSEEGAVLDKSVNGNKENKIESNIVGRPHQLLDSKGTVQEEESQAIFVNKTRVSDESAELNMPVNHKAPEIKVDSTADSTLASVSLGAVVVDGVLNGAKDSKKGIGAENVVFKIPYSSNGSVMDKDGQSASINKSQVPNQSDGFAILVESETKTIANSIPGLSSLEAIADATLIDSGLDGKKGNDVKHDVVGIPYTSQEQKGGFFDRLSLWTKKAPIPNQSTEVAKTEIPQIPEPVVTVVPDSPPDHPSLGEVTVGNVLGGAVSSNEGPVAISIDDSLEERVDLEPSGVKGLEVLKSMVYGGLTELITSLGIVTSAASADAATGNIVALALANLISGLFIIGHNLAVLKSERFQRTSSEADGLQMDRYEETLGKRENYFLHFAIAILSFLVFGLMPPLVYGFSFTKSNDKDLKLAAVAGASLLCIVLLAIGKAHTQKPSKWDVYFKTVVCYVVIGGGAAGLSYLAGDLIDKLINKYGLFEPTPPLNLPPFQISLAKPGWGSY